MLGTITPSQPESKTCEQKSLFLFGSLAKEILLFISAARTRLAKLETENKPCSKSKHTKSYL